MPPNILNFSPDDFAVDWRNACHLCVHDPLNSVSVPEKSWNIPHLTAQYSLQLVVWLVPSLIINAIAVSFIGVLFGPMYPIAISHAGRIIPRELVTGAIGWITASAAGGAALVPFVAGMVAGRLGIGSLQPL